MDTTKLGQAQMPKRQPDGNGIAQAGDLCAINFSEGLFLVAVPVFHPTLGSGFPDCHILSELGSAVPVSAGVPYWLRGCGP
jgi:hypothetical protein